MSIQNLERKLEILVDKLKNKDRNSQLKLLDKFIKTELNLLEQIRYLEEKDIFAIKTRALSLHFELSTNTVINGKSLFSQGELANTYCYAQAVLDFLRGKNLFPYIMEIQKNQETLPICSHNIVSQIKSRTYKCKNCDSLVEPVLWNVKTSSE